jgi:hypothetical protein
LLDGRLSLFMSLFGMAAPLRFNLLQLLRGRSGG